MDDDGSAPSDAVVRAPGTVDDSPPGPRASDLARIRAQEQLIDDDTDGKTWRDRLQEMADTTDGSVLEDGIGVDERVDRVAAFAPAILALRWGTTVASLALATQDSDHDQWLIIGWSVVIVFYTVLRTIKPIRYFGDIKSLLLVVAEVVLHVMALITTGYWESPFILTLLTAIAVAGFARGFGFGLRIGVASAAAVSLPFLLEDPSETRIVVSGQWTLVLLLVALIAGYARRISGEADRQHTLALDRLGRLADANALLFSLHRVTQTLPASLDLDDVLETTIGRLKGLFEFDAAVILAFDDTDGDWQVLRREGAGRLKPKFGNGELPSPMREAIATSRVMSVGDLSVLGASGLTPKASSALYAVLTARGATIGLIALEDSTVDHFSARDAELFEGFIEPVALAIDNARWFARLRTVGADEERTRIARDLHDRIGQSLAYLAFELDRIVAKEEGGGDIGDELDRLRGDVRGVIREVRDTLYDLRTDVSDSQDMAATLEAYVARVQERTGIEIDLYCDRGPRLPLLQEREMWRIAQEAMANVERHAKASAVRIIWRCNGESAALEVTDNGQGFPIGTAGRLDSYGILGMRERASSIGATLEMDSHLGKGTRVRCSLVRPPAQAASGPDRIVGVG